MWPRQMPCALHHHVHLYAPPGTPISRLAAACGIHNQASRACYDRPKMPSADSHPVANLFGKSADELREWMTSLSEPAYRGTQIYHALYAERRFDLAAITNLPADLRERLGRQAVIALPQIVRRHQSSDGAIRYVLALEGEKTVGIGGAAKAATVETVFMPSESRQTICISTQAGCAVDCRFCLTATLGLIRNLSAAEILGQVLIALEENRASLRPQT